MVIEHGNNDVSKVNKKKISVTNQAENFNWSGIPWKRMRYSTAYIGEKIRHKFVVDMGCSDGYQTLFLAACWQPKHIVGLDNFGHAGGAPECKKRAKRMIEASQLENISIEVSDAFNTPFNTGSIDVLMCSQALHHFFACEEDLRVLDEEKLNVMTLKLQEWLRVLKPNGKLLVKETAKYCFPRLLAKWGIPRGTRRIDFKTKQEPAAWCFLLNKAGFHIEDITYYVPYSLRHLKSLVQVHMVNFWFNMTYFIQASA